MERAARHLQKVKLSRRGAHPKGVREIGGDFGKKVSLA